MTGRHVAPQTKGNARAEADGRYRAALAGRVEALPRGVPADAPTHRKSAAIRKQLLADYDRAMNLPEATS